MYKLKRSQAKVLLVVITLLSMMAIFNLRPTSAYRISEYRVPAAAKELKDPRPQSIILNENENQVFFTEQLVGRIGRMPTSGDERLLREYVLPTDPILGYSEPWDIFSVTENQLFITDYHQNRIWVLWYDTNSLTYFDIPTPGSGPRGIYVLDGGTEIWFTEFLEDKIVRLRLTGGSLQVGRFLEYQLPIGSGPNNIVVHGDCVYWTEYNSNKIGKLDKSTGIITRYSLSGGSRPWDLTVDPDGMIWFTESGTSVNSIGMLNPFTGLVIEHRSIPTGSSEPRGIKIDNSTRDVWFTEFAGHKVAKYIPGTNRFVEFPTITPYSAPADLVIKKSASFTEAYFTEWSANRIGIIMEGPDIVSFGTTSTITATKITTGVTGSYKAGTGTTSYTTATSRFTSSNTAAPSICRYTASSTNGTTTILSNTVYKHSTSTKGTYTSYISEVIYTTSTLTSISTSHISTESRTSTNRSFVTSTSYTGTTSVTYSTTRFHTVYTATQSLTSTSTLSVPATVTTTLVSTKYKSTTSGLTTVTDTQTAQVLQTQTLYTSITTPGTPTTTQYLTVNTTVAPTLPFSCFIASAAYGSDVSPSVQYLRNFRDQLALSTFAGRSFIEAFNSWYYSFSPIVADAISSSPSTKALVRAALTPLFAILRVSASVFSILGFNPELGIIMSGIVASSLIGVVYVMPLLTPVLIGLKRRYYLKLKLNSLLPVYGGVLGALALILISEIAVNGVLMRFSTATLVLSTMIGSAATLSLLCLDKIGQYLSLK